MLPMAENKVLPSAPEDHIAACRVHAKDIEAVKTILKTGPCIVHRFKV